MTVKDRKQREKQAREKWIINTAERIIFAEGIDKTSMSDIADAAELSKGTLYLYFKNKDDLVHAIIARGLKIMLKDFKIAVADIKKGIDKLFAIGKAYFSFCQKYPLYFQVLMFDESHKHPQGHTDDYPFIKECEQRSNEIFGLMVEVIEIGLADGSLQTSINPLKLALIFRGNATGVMQIIRNKGTLLKEHFAIEPNELFFDSLEVLRDSLRVK